LLKTLAGVLPHTGTVSLVGTPLSKVPLRERARQMAWLGQNETSADDLTVWDVAMLGRLPHQAWLAPASAADEAAVSKPCAPRRPGTGVAVPWASCPAASANGCCRHVRWLSQAQVLLMDEPLANLDPPHQADWLAVVQALVEQGNTRWSALLHEIGMALHADRVVVSGQRAFAAPRSQW